MRASTRALLAACLLVALPGGLFAGLIDQAVGQISQASYTNYLTAPNFLYTHAGDNRNNGTPQFNAAVANVRDAFLSFGLTTTIENAPTYQNVVGRKVGTSRPNDIYIVGAHLDSVGNPGADDDASGVAGVLECARVLSEYASEATLVFVTFDQEEDGLRGSAAYAAAARARGDNILGMVELDMIAYSGGGNAANIYGRTTSGALKLAVEAAVETYGGIACTIGGALNASDHAPFEAQGYQACVLIENYWANPNYHTANDNVDVAGYLDYAYATGMVRGTVAYLAGAAGIVPEPATLGIAAFGVVVLILRRSPNRPLV